MEKFNYVVVGSGPSVYRFLLGMKDSKKKILVVEKKRFGGICPNEGCEPKIFLEGAVRAVLISRKLEGKGIETPGKLNWQRLIQYKKEVFAPFPKSTQQMYEGLGAQTLTGTASFIDSHHISVESGVIEADNFVIATGRTPRQLSFPGQEYTLTSTDIFDLEDLPKRIAIIGSGYVGMEIATLLAAAGSDVTIIQHSDRPLRSFYSQHVQQLVNEMKDSLGIEFKFNTSVKAITKKESGYQLETTTGDKSNFDTVVNASGRVPNLGSLNLSAAGVEATEDGIKTNDFLQSSSENIYALGDVLSKKVPGLTPTAQFEGDYLSALFTEKETKPIQYPVIGTVAFTFPQVAQAGINIDEARNNEKYVIKDIDITAGDFFYQGTADNARLTIVYDKKTGRLKGASEISQTAVDDINNLIPVMSLDVQPDDWKKKMLMAFPGLAYKIRNLV